MPALCILLAEDNLVNQKVAVRQLEKWGHRVTVAGNGREALATLERQAFDVVLMDVQMPGMDGFETAAVVRERICDGLQYLGIELDEMRNAEHAACISSGRVAVRVIRTDEESVIAKLTAQCVGISTED